VGDKIKKNEMDMSYSTYGDGRDVYSVWWEDLRKRAQWGDPVVDGRIILRQIFRKWDEGYGLN
jgi:hypothetical protein